MKKLFAALLFSLAITADGHSKNSVSFTSPCTCEGNHGVARWAAKTDAQMPPSNQADIQRLTPADICAWKGLGAKPSGKERLPEEQKWYAVEGKIAAVKVEEDGDIHIEMTNADGRPGRIVVELPLGETWCSMRRTAFSWTDAKFPILRGQFKTTQHPIVTVIGKAFYDIDHDGGDEDSNERGKNSAVAIWEIHPVMEIRLGNQTIASPPSTETAPAPTAASSPVLPNESKPAPQSFVRITKPVAIQIPYGTTIIPRGMKLPVISRTDTTVRVRYENAVYDIPISSTLSE